MHNMPAEGSQGTSARLGGGGGCAIVAENFAEVEKGKRWEIKEGRWEIKEG